MVAERITRGFWPVWTILSALIAALSFGVLDHLSLEVFWIAAVLSLLGLVASLVIGARRFRWPTTEEAMARLDASLPGRPLSMRALTGWWKQLQQAARTAEHPLNTGLATEFLVSSAREALNSRG